MLNIKKQLNKFEKALIIIAIFAIISIVLIVYLFYFSKKTQIETSPQTSSQEDLLIKKQIEELNRLNEGATPITEEVRNKQIEELNKLNKESKKTPLSQEVIDKQIEELNRLKN